MLQEEPQGVPALAGDGGVTVERHPWAPYVPPCPRVLMLGTFPPQPKRWSMDFYYPNPSNDMWRVMGLLFFGDRDALWDAGALRFRLDDIRALLDRHGIALWDTGMAVRRLRDNASDKYLEIVEPIDLAGLLDAHPTIAAVVATGEKASGVVAALAGSAVPAVGHSVDCELAGHRFAFWRMPSTSRAYPLPLEKKAAAYAAVFEQCIIHNS